MALENLKSIFQDELLEKTELFQSNQPIDRFDTKLNYNENSFNKNTFTFSTDLTQRGGRDNPLLDSLLRGRVYEPIRFSQDFQNNNLFVKPETGEITEQLFKDQTFDPRATTPKEGTLYFNTNNSFNPATNPTDFSTAIGNNELPFTPITSLGGQFKENLSWKNLYNKDHTPKTEPKYKGINAINYGPNVNRDKLDIRNNQSRVSIFSPSRTDLVSFGDGEPYMVSEIPTSDNSTSGGRLLNFGSQEVPIGRALVDAVRLGKYLTSPSGLLFIAKQNLLGLASKSEAPLLSSQGEQPSTMVSPQRFGLGYNPLSSILAAGGRLLGPQPNIKIRKDTLLPGVFATQVSYGVGSGTTGGVSYDVNIGFTGNKFAITDASTNFPIAAGAKFKTPGLRSGDMITLANMIKGTNLNSTGITTVSEDENELPSGGLNNPLVNVEKVESGLPFYFNDMRDNTYIFFRAYIEGLTENVSPSYASHNYIGRSEPVYIYERGEREISMTLKLVAQTKSELNKIYEKMNRLTSLCYPQYTSDIPDFKDPYGNRMKPPYTKLRYGDMFGKQNNELMGYMKSLSYTVEQSSTYETEVGKRVPRHVIATIGYQVIHDKAPRLGTKFYGFIGEQNG